MNVQYPLTRFSPVLTTAHTQEAGGRCLRTFSSESSPWLSSLALHQEDKWFFNSSANSGWLVVDAGGAILRRFLKSSLGLARESAPIAL